jgi:hypothetical protein
MIWTAMGIAMFGIAAWQDGEPWRSGFCLGVAACVAFNAIMEALELTNRRVGETTLNPAAPPPSEGFSKKPSPR